MSLILRLKRGLGPSISVGSATTGIADVNIDISRICHPDIVGDALHLPIASNQFLEAFFTDVMEHLPAGTELQALKEIYRVMARGGRLILSTPSGRTVFSLLDPARYVMGHRHYSIGPVLSLLQSANFRIEKFFTAGGIFAMIGVIWYSIVTFPAKKLLGNRIPYSPAFLLMLENKEYLRDMSNEGYSVFVVATKV